MGRSASRRGRDSPSPEATEYGGSTLGIVRALSASAKPSCGRRSEQDRPLTVPGPVSVVSTVRAGRLDDPGAVPVVMVPGASTFDRVGRGFAWRDPAIEDAHGIPRRDVFRDTASVAGPAVGPADADSAPGGSSRTGRSRPRSECGPACRPRSCPPRRPTSHAQERGTAPEARPHPRPRVMVGPADGVAAGPTFRRTVESRRATVVPCSLRARTGRGYRLPGDDLRPGDRSSGDPLAIRERGTGSRSGAVRDNGVRRESGSRGPRPGCARHRGLSASRPYRRGGASARREGIAARGRRHAEDRRRPVRASRRSPGTVGTSPTAGTCRSLPFVGGSIGVAPASDSPQRRLAERLAPGPVSYCTDVGSPDDPPARRAERRIVRCRSECRPVASAPRAGCRSHGRRPKARALPSRRSSKRYRPAALEHGPADAESLLATPLPARPSGVRACRLRPGRARARAPNSVTLGGAARPPANGGLRGAAHPLRPNERGGGRRFACGAEAHRAVADGDQLPIRGVGHRLPDGRRPRLGRDRTRPPRPLDRGSEGSSRAGARSCPPAPIRRR